MGALVQCGRNYVYSNDILGRILFIKIHKNKAEGTQIFSPNNPTALQKLRGNLLSRDPKIKWL